MPIKIRMPKIGLNMMEGTINEWMVKEGQSVKKGDVLYVVETDKITNDVQSPAEGIIYKILVNESEVVPVKKIVAVLAQPGEEIDLSQYLKDDTVEKKQSFDKKVKQNAERDSEQSTALVSGQVLTTPYVKRLAAKEGIDLKTIEGSGPNGRILSKDIARLIESKQGKENEGNLPEKKVPLNSVRKVVAKRMAEAAATIPMVTLNSTLDVTPIATYRENRKKSQNEQSNIPSLNAIIISVTSKALIAHPYLNASFEKGNIRLITPIHIGLAVNTQEGLKVVVIRNADEKSIDNIHQEVSVLTERAQNNQSIPKDLTGSTFTVTNLGMFGIDSFNPIINPPEAGILGIGKFSKRESSKGESEDNNFHAIFSLTFDHRVIDGAPAAQFLQNIQEHIFALAS